MSNSLDKDHIAILGEHLPYELDMLDEALGAWDCNREKPDETRKEWFARMAAIEAFWVHARNLEEFFENRPDGRTAAASHFLGGVSLNYSEADVTKLIKKVQEQIVHLNYDRAAEMGNRLSYYDAFRTKGHIDRATQQFQKHLTADARKYWKHRTSQMLTFPETPPSPSSQFSTPANARS